MTHVPLSLFLRGTVAVRMDQAREETDCVLAEQVRQQ
jgi:hypothetical protein